MSHFDAWQWIIGNWHSQEWQAIPDNVRSILNLDSRLGMFNGMLITHVSAIGVREFVQKMNRAR
jgi:hypothetical protein